MKKYNIAFTGVFNIENYGDHLFPVIFEKVLEHKGISYELTLFSPLGGKQGYGLNVPTYSLTMLDKLHKQKKFDAIIIGGGGILHYSTGKQLLNKSSSEFVDYPVFETWVLPSVFAMNNNVKIIWNLPGGFQPFVHALAPLTKVLCSVSDYISVRDNYTKNLLIDCKIDEDKIFTCVDSAFLISDYFPLEKLKKRKCSLLPEHKYVVFHANIHFPEDEIHDIARILIQLRKKGYDIAFLPIAYTHNDQYILNKVYQTIVGLSGTEEGLITFDDNLTVLDIMSILANTDLYIGVSFHGAVTASCYQRKVIVYDYMRNGKTKDLFSSLQKEEYYITQIEQLENAVNHILEVEIQYDLVQHKKDLEKHFNNMLDVMFQPMQDKQSHCLEYFSEFVAELNTQTQQYDALKERCMYLENERNTIYVNNQELIAKNNELNAKNNELNAKNNELNAKNNELLQRLNRIEKMLIYRVLKKMKRIVKRLTIKS